MFLNFIKIIQIMITLKECITNNIKHYYLNLYSDKKIIFGIKILLKE